MIITKFDLLRILLIINWLQRSRLIGIEFAD